MTRHKNFDALCQSGCLPKKTKIKHNKACSTSSIILATIKPNRVPRRNTLFQDHNQYLFAYRGVSQRCPNAYLRCLSSWGGGCRACIALLEADPALELVSLGRLRVAGTGVGKGRKKADLGRGRWVDWPGKKGGTSQVV